jgi:ABC-type glycerol-3-phosphate transport system substrate-binding protein
MRYGIPRYANVFTYYYNQDYFAESGVPFLPDLDKAGNWNWDTLLQISKKLTRTDGNKITRWALDDDSQQYPGGRGSGWIISAGGKFFDTPSNPTKFMLDQQPALAGLQFMQDLIWKHQITPPMNARGQADFTKGLAAMNLWLGTSRIGLMEQKLTFNWDLGPKPMGPASRGYYLASDMLHINAASPHPEAAWKLLKYLVSTEGQVANMQETGQGPVRRSAYPQYQAMYPKRATIYHLNSMLDSFILFLDDASANLINKAVRDNIATNKKSPAQAIGEISGPIQALYQ